MNKETDIQIPRRRITVTQEILDRACRANAHRCMIAEAIKEQVPGAQRVAVDLRTIRWSDPKKGLRYVYMVPPIAADALIRFDKGMSLRPFRFRLANAHVTSMMIGNKENPKRAHQLGRPRLVRTPKQIREGSSGDIIGGTRRELTSIIGIQGREYGKRLYTSLFDEPREMPEAEFKAHLKGYVSQAGVNPKRKKST
jgi:hypothetical protein